MCDRRTTVAGGVITLLTSVSTIATQAMAAAPPPCFSGTNMTASSNAAANAAAPSGVSGVDTSTTKILEMVAERRENEKQSCPAGYALVGNACEPVSAAADTGTATEEPSAPSAAPPKSKPKPAKADEAAPSREGQPVSTSLVSHGYGAWAEGFGDYEERDGLTINGARDVERDQKVAGFLAGLDRTKRFSPQSGVLLGVLAGYSRNSQKYSPISSSDPSVSTDYNFRFKDPG